MVDADGTDERANWLDGVRLGGGTFTRLPMTPPRVVDPFSGRVAILGAPMWGAVVGLIAGGLAAVVWWWLGRGGNAGALGALLCAAVALAASAWLSRGLHLDGLADTLDGFASMRRGAQALAVMRDPNIGALGAVGLVFVVLLQVLALAMLVSKTDPLGVVLVVTAATVIGRGVLPWAVRAGTPSAPSGLGAVVVGTVPTWLAAAVTALSALATAALLLAAGLGITPAALAALAALVGSLALRRSALRRFGVLSGDVLGAVVEVATTCALLLAAIAA